MSTAPNLARRASNARALPGGRRVAAAVAGAVGALAVVLALIASPTPEPALASTHLPSLRVGITHSAGEANNLIADERGYFRKTGVEVGFVVGFAGVESLDALVAGKVDVALVASAPVVEAALRLSANAPGAPPRLRIVASVFRSSRLEFVAVRADRGISKPADLHGRTLGLARGTGSELFWHRFAEVNAIDRSRVEVVFVPPGELESRLARGTLDAVAAWEPFRLGAKDATLTPVIRFPGPEVHLTTRLIVVRDADVPRLAPALERYLRALGLAEADLRAEPSAALRIHAARIGVAAEQLARVYGLVSFELRLDEVVLGVLDSQARWALGQGPGAALPDFRSLLWREPLKAVKPEGVALMR